MSAQYYYSAKAKSGTEVSVYAMVTFEGHPVMPLHEFSQHRKIASNATVPVIVKVLKPSGIELLKDLKMTFGEFQYLLKNFEEYGPEYANNYQFAIL